LREYIFTCIYGNKPQTYKIRTKPKQLEFRSTKNNTNNKCRRSH